jgi:hypothetical protein
MRETRHFREMLEERNIRCEWVDAAVTDPTRVEDRDDGTRHFLRQIPEHDHRWLRVIVNVRETPPAKVTAFFDRRLRSRKL